MKHRRETLDKELIINDAIRSTSKVLQRELFHYIVLIVGSILYLIFNNLLFHTITSEYRLYKKLLIIIFVLYPLVCCIFGAFMAIFKVGQYTYLQRLSISVFKLLAMFFVATAFIFTIFQVSSLFIKF